MYQLPLNSLILLSNSYEDFLLKYSVNAVRFIVLRGYIFYEINENVLTLSSKNRTDKIIISNRI